MTRFHVWDEGTPNCSRSHALLIEAETAAEAAEEAARLMVDDRDWPEGHSYVMKVVPEGAPLDEEPDKFQVTPDAEAMAKVEMRVTVLA